MLLITVISIVGLDFKIPEEISGRMIKIEEYTKVWLDQNMAKYVKR